MRDTRSIVYSLVIIVFFGAILAYTYFEGRNYVAGPQITVIKPKNYELIRNNLVSIEGQTKNISKLILNDRNISIDENGNFKEKIMMANGYNLILIKGSDRFGKNKEISIEINVAGLKNTPTQANNTESPEVQSQ